MAPSTRSRRQTDDGEENRILRGAVFKIFPLEARTETNQLNIFISRLGGIILDESTSSSSLFSSSTSQDPLLKSYVIPIVDKAWCRQNNITNVEKPAEDTFKDLFSSEFIYKTFSKKRRMALTKFRWCPSMFEEYDANLLLDRKLTWDELCALSADNITVTTVNRESRDVQNTTPNVETRPQQQQQGSADSSASANNSTASTSGPSSNSNTRDPENPNLTSTPRRTPNMNPFILLDRIDGIPTVFAPPRTPTPRNLELVRNGSPNVFNRWRYQQRRQRNHMISRRVRYTEEESRCLLGFICHHGLHQGICGRSLWINIEKLGVWRRTWQSLKEHFKKSIYPKLEEMNCPSGDIDKFKEAEEHRGKGRREPFTEFPDYDVVPRV